MRETNLFALGAEAEGRLNKFRNVQYYKVWGYACVKVKPEYKPLIMRFIVVVNKFSLKYGLFKMDEPKILLNLQKYYLAI